MAINLTFHELDNTTADANNQTAYQKLRFDLIVNTEGVKKTIYPDSVGIPSIGIGFNLKDTNILGKILDSFGVADQTSRDALQKIVTDNASNIANLTNALNIKMGTLFTHTPPLANRATFTFNNADEMKAVFDEAVLTYDNSDTNLGPLGRVDNWLADIPPSNERAVLVSMSYNGYINRGESPSLRRAIMNGDRAEAWFEIRYNRVGEFRGQYTYLMSFEG